MAYTTINKSSSFMNTKLYTSTGNDNLAISGVGFEPSLTWIKKRNVVSGSDTNEWHMWADQVRGSGYYTSSNSTNGQASTTTDLKSWQSDGFTLGTDNKVNQGSTPYTYASWNFKAGTSFSNSAGANGASLASTGSVSTDGGFSIVSYTGYSPNASTVYHGLNSVPKMIIFKRLTGVANWATYHHSLGNTKAIFLNTSTTFDAHAGYFNNTTPTSSVFSVANSGDTNSNGNPMIAYCFAEKTGHSKFGIYTANQNANGPFIYTGMKVSWVMIKRIGTDPWVIYDNKRDPENVAERYLMANEQSSETEEGSSVGIDFVSNGFKIRGTSGKFNSTNSGVQYLYMAFGQTLVGSNNVPTTAR